MASHVLDTWYCTVDYSSTPVSVYSLFKQTRERERKNSGIRVMNENKLAIAVEKFIRT